MQGKRIDILRPAVPANEPTFFPVVRDCFGYCQGLDFELLIESRRLGNGFQPAVQDGNSNQVFPVAESSDDSLKLFERPSVEIGLDVCDETLSKNLRPALQVISQTLLLPPDFVVRGEQGNESNADYERNNQANAKQPQVISPFLFWKLSRIQYLSTLEPRDASGRSIVSC